MKTSLAAMALVPVSALAQTAPAPSAATQLPQVVITATRVESNPFDVPASVDRIEGSGLRDARPQVNLSESMGGVPGLLARDRQNYAQDQQVSVRGFGARSTFGIRGVRVIVDGIPATLPDGQGQLSHIDLASADRIEVLRGPFSALYGNSSGGVIEVFTEDGDGPPTLGLSAAVGSDSTYRAGLKVAGGSRTFGYVLSANRFATDGYRDHSETRRDIGNLKLTGRPDADTRITVVLNSMALPKAEDPLGLTRAQWDADPRSVDANAIAFNTRKTVEQTQLGATLERSFGAAGTLRVMAYGGHRGTEQFQAIPRGVPTATPPTVQFNPLHPGGVILLGRDYTGTDVRWTLKGGEAQPYTLVAGVSYDVLDEHRRGLRNFIGTTLGVEGELRRDEDNKATSFDQYVQGSWRFAPRWRIDLGIRHSVVRFRSHDNFIAGPNPDDSGSVRYSGTLPVAGLMYSLSERVHVYAAAGRGFETPTLNEISYRPNGLTGLNFAVQPARSDNLELGVKTRDEAIGTLNVALFETRTENEIVTATNVGGRATFQNAGKTRRRGVEAAWSRTLWGDLQGQAAYTWLDARYREGFSAIASGNRIPGVARQSLYAALGWLPATGWRGGVEARALSKVYVNDANAEAAPGFATAGAHVGYVAKWGDWDWRAFARVDNLFDRRYAGSVIVNEGNGRFYEPAPGRTFLLGVSGGIAF